MINSHREIIIILGFIMAIYCTWDQWSYTSAKDKIFRITGLLWILFLFFIYKLI